MRIIIYTFIICILSFGIVKAHEEHKIIPTVDIEKTELKIITKEVFDVFFEVVGKYPKTEIVKIKNWNKYSSIIGYCQMGNANFPSYISINMELFNNLTPDQKFQVILHEYTHCEFKIGHLEVYGNYMNNGGAPFLSKEEVINQFKIIYKTLIRK